MAWVNFSVRDYSDEYGQVAFEVADMQSIETPPDWISANLTPLHNAIDGVSLGTIAREHARLFEGGTDTNPGTPLAQREFGLRVFYQDGNNNKYNLTIPCVDLVALTIEQGTDRVTLADGGPMAALVSAMESAMQKGGSAITVTSAFIVGRNS